MDNNKNHSLIILAIMLMFLILLVSYVTMLQPAYKKLGDKKDQVVQLQKTTELLTKALSNKKEKGKLPEQEIQATLPLWDNTEQMIVSLKEIGLSTQTKLSSVSFSVSETNQLNTLIGTKEPMYPSVKELKTQLVIQGSYEQIRSWLVEVQKLPRLVIVDNIRYSMAISGSISAEISITAFFDPSYAFMLDNPVLPKAAE
ncbi:hypothetical protein AB4Z45_17415 [Paenibacillus sp. MCAF9]|uniref:hypothetical protein n=1 Tax=unclassified Paenibacillus TaxID=185978 RepID=UPI003F982D9E